MEVEVAVIIISREEKPEELEEQEPTSNASIAGEEE